MPILLLFFPIIAFFSLLGSLVLFAYLFTIDRASPKFDYDPSIDERNSPGASFVSIVVTARNEEQMISNCLDSLVNQTYQKKEIIVVDDSSTDRTAEIVQGFATKNPFLRLVTAGPKPEGWVGKSWPCWRGFQEARGEYILFVDADSEFEKTVVEKTVLYSSKNSIDIFSLAPKVRFTGIWAGAVLPLITGAINLLYPMKKVNDKGSKRAYVFGTFFLIRKEVYEKTGGHSKVRSELVEDAAIGQLVKSHGYNLRIEKGTNLLSTEWESDPRAIFHGLERVVSSSIKSYGMISIINAILLFLLIVYPLLYILGVLVLHSISGVFLAGVIASFLNVFVFLSLASLEMKVISGSANLPYSFLYILGGVIFISAIITTSIKVVSGKELYWKGQGYRQGSEVSLEEARTA